MDHQHPALALGGSPAFLPMSMPVPRLDCHDRDNVNVAEVGVIGRRAVWHTEESLVLLDVIRNGNFVAKICDKNAKKSYLFEELSTQLAEQNIFRNGKQVECHWKHLRRTYFQLKQKIDEEGVSEDATRTKWEPYIYIKSIFDSASDPEFLLGQGNVEFIEGNDDSYIKFETETESGGGSPADPFGSFQGVESEPRTFSSSIKPPYREMHMHHVPIVELGAELRERDPGILNQSNKRIITLDEHSSVEGSHKQQHPGKRRRLNDIDIDDEINYGGHEREREAGRVQTSREKVDVDWSNMVRYEKALMERQEKFIQYMEKVRTEETKREEKRAEETREWQMKLMNLQFQHQSEMVQNVMSTFVEIAKIFTSKPP